MNVSMKWCLSLLVTMSLVAHSGVVADTWLAMDGDVVGGVVNCNASDTTIYSCFAVPGAPPSTNCGSVIVIDTSLNQQWRDGHGTSKVVCTTNQCANTTKWKVDTSDGCVANLFSD